MGITYEVQQGDCLSSIAAQWGFPDYQEIYLDPANAGFRERRPNPNIIAPGDILFIPERRIKNSSCPTDRLHRFRLKRPKVLLRLCVQDDLHEPYRNKRYSLTVGSQRLEGNTDSDGLLEQTIEADASDATLTIFLAGDDPSDEGYTFALNLGHLDPVDETAGIDGRLINLGFGPHDASGMELSSEDRAGALRSFQRRFGLQVTGEADEPTLAKLSQLHDGT